MKKDMNKDKETLSQLMDGEWDSINPAEQVEAICADDELKSSWSRYHLIRDVIRNDELTIDTDLSSRIMSAIDDEPVYSNVSAISPGIKTTATTTEPVKKTSNVRTGLTGLALAACVAMATVIGLNVWQGAPTGPNSGSATIATTSAPTIAPGLVLPEVEYVSNSGTYWVTPEATRSAKSEQRLNALLSTHIEQSPTAERTGMLPYSRLVGYESVVSE